MSLKETIPVYDPNVAPVYDINKVSELLPHRYPFLMVDKIIAMDEECVIGIKNVTTNEPFFQGHFPNNPIMPGVLQLEALAQCGGILCMNLVDPNAKFDTYFLKIDGAKFKAKVLPGDTLILKMVLKEPIRRGICIMYATAYVGNKLVCEAEMVAQIVKQN